MHERTTLSVSSAQLLLLFLCGIVGLSKDGGSFGDKRNVISLRTVSNCWLSFNPLVSICKSLEDSEEVGSLMATASDS